MQGDNSILWLETDAIQFLNYSNTLENQTNNEMPMFVTSLQ